MIAVLVAMYLVCLSSCVSPLRNKPCYGTGQIKELAVKALKTF